MSTSSSVRAARRSASAVTAGAYRRHNHAVTPRQPDPAPGAEPERGFLLGVYPKGSDGAEELAELTELARTAGVAPIGSLVQHRAHSDPRTFVGKGKLTELKAEFGSSDAEVLLADDELTPPQQRALEDALNTRVVDRTQLILDIFAQHARSAEGKLQVELAQLEYNLPRMLKTCARVRRIIEPEPDRRRAPISEICDDRVVGVDDQCRFRGKSSDHGAPALGHELELAVAVQLIAKEVPERHNAGTEAAHGLRQRGLVDLEEAEVGPARIHQRGGETGHQVRARPIPGERLALAEDLCRHRRRRGLAVRRGDDSHAVCEASSEQVDSLGVELPQHLARDRRSASTACCARQTTQRACRRRLERQTKPHRRASVPTGEGRGCSGELAELTERSKLFAGMARKRSPKRASVRIDEAALAAFRAGMRRRYTDEEILAELREAAERLGRSPTMREFAGDPGARVHPQTVIEHFGT